MMTDKDMMTDVASWPYSGRFWFCCVKNYGGTKEDFPSLENFGMLVSLNHETIERAPDNAAEEGVTIFRDCMPPINFSSLQELLDAGWIVD
jgi:hypothetical protein